MLTVNVCLCLIAILTELMFHRKLNHKQYDNKNDKTD